MAVTTSAPQGRLSNLRFEISVSVFVAKLQGLLAERQNGGRGSARHTYELAEPLAHRAELILKVDLDSLG